ANASPGRISFRPGTLSTVACSFLATRSTLASETSVAGESRSLTTSAHGQQSARRSSERLAQRCGDVRDRAVAGVEQPPHPHDPVEHAAVAGVIHAHARIVAAPPILLRPVPTA